MVLFAHAFAECEFLFVFVPLAELPNAEWSSLDDDYLVALSIAQAWLIET